MIVHESSRIINYKELYPNAGAEEIAGAYPIIGLTKIREFLSEKLDKSIIKSKNIGDSE